MKQQYEMAVSPVVGVMLMLVVVIIIAAVVSGFAGGLIGGNNQKPPQLSMDVKLANGGYWSNSYLMMSVTGVDAPIPTKDLKIITSWSKTNADGTKLTGGNTAVPGVYNFKAWFWSHSGAQADDWYAVAPMGYGPGVVDQNGTSVMSMFWVFNTINSSLCTGAEYSKDGKTGHYCQFSDINGRALGNSSWFGNYNLVSGTTMFARPFGAAYGGSKTGSSGYEVGYGMTGNTTSPGETQGGGRFYYSYGNSYNPHGGTSPTTPTATFTDSFGTGDGQSEDMMMALLGEKWNYLRAGDTVSIKVVHIPTGKTIFNKDVSVEG